MKLLMKVIEWNINGSSATPCVNKYEIPKWVVNEVISQRAECVVITGLALSKGWDYFQQKLEWNDYNWFVSATTGANGIVIAIKKNETYAFMQNSFKNSQIFGETVVPDFGEVRFKIGEDQVSIIGVRIKRDIKNEDPYYRIRQFICLDNYLSNLRHKVICVGDFGTNWAGNWKKESNYTLPQTAKIYDIYTPPYRESNNWFSCVNFADSKRIKMQYDHLITNCRAENPSYDWNFIKEYNGCGDLDKVFYNKVFYNKLVGLPEHAVFKVDVDLSV